MDFTDPPFFIVGVPRSGTTLLRLMLNSHPRLAIPFESGFITSSYKQLNRYGDLQDKANCRRLLADISEMHVARLSGLVDDPERILSRPITSYRDFVCAVFAEYAAKQGKPRWGDKTPAYLEQIEVLATLFPECRIIHVVRDGRDVALSCRRLGWFPPSIPWLARDWRYKVILARKMGTLLGDEKYMEVRFEDLVLDPEKNLRSVCRFLDESYDEGMLQFTQEAPEAMPEGTEHWHATSMSAPDASKVFEWKRKMSRTDRILYEKHSGGALEKFGYDKEHLPPTWRSRLKEFYYLNFSRW